MSKIYEPLDDLKASDLPEKTLPFWKIAGPGAILVGLSIGTGEIVIWPRIAAEYGGSMVWAAMVGIFIQLRVNFEVARWTIATGETVYTGYSRVWRGFAPLFILLTLVSWIAPGWGRAAGACAESLAHWFSGLGFRYILDSDYVWGCDAHPVWPQTYL